MEDHKRPKEIKDQVLVEDVQESLGEKLTVYQTYESYSADFAAETERKLVRKIDLRLMPLLVTIYIFNYLDRNSITQARLYGLQDDLGVRGATYQTAISIFSAGYIIMQLPSTLLMAKLRPSIFLVSRASSASTSHTYSRSLHVSLLGRFFQVSQLRPKMLRVCSRSDSAWVL